MKDSSIRRMLHVSPIGFARHEIVLNESGKPDDYRFLVVNKMFEKLTGLEASRITGKKVSEVLPGVREDRFDWIGFYGRIAMEGGSESFEQYSEPLGRWYSVQAYSEEKGFFNTVFIDVTEQKRKSDELENFFDVNLDLLCIADVEGNFIKVNREWENVLGYPADELQRSKFLDFVHPDDIDMTLDAMKQLGHDKPVVNFINRYRSRDGSYRDIEWRSHPKGKYIYAAARDVTRRLNLEQALKQSREQFESMVSNMPGVVFRCRYDRDWTMLYMSSEAESVTGYPVSDFLENRVRSFESVIHPDDREMVRKVIGEAIEGKTPWNLEYRIFRKDGKEAWIQERGRALLDQEGGTSYLDGFLLDVTGLKMAEEQKKRQLLFQQIAAKTSALFTGIMTSAEFDREVAKTLKALGEFFGADRSYLFEFSDDLSTMSNTHEWCSEGTMPQMDRIQNVPVDIMPWFKKRITGGDHVFIPVVDRMPPEAAEEKREFSAQGIQSLLSVALYGVRGKLTGFTGFDMVHSSYSWTDEEIDMLKVIAGIIGNTIERLRTDEKRRESDERVRQITENMREVFWLRSADNRQMLYVSPAYEKVWKRSCESLYANPSSFMDSIYEDDKPLVFQAFNNYAETGIFDLEYRIVTPDEEVRWIHARSFPVRDEAGEVIRHSGMATDITDRVLKEQELIKEKRQTDIFFNQSLHGFFICMLDEPVEWNDETDKETVLEYILDHQRMTRVNQAMLDQYGAKEKDFLGITIRELFRHDLDHAREIWRGLFDKGSWHVETREQKMDGTPIIIDGDYICLYDDDGRVTGHFGVQVDVTAQRKAETALNESRERIRQILANTPAVVFTYTVDTEGKPDLVFINDKVKEILGYAPEDFIGNMEFWSSRVHPDDLQKVMSKISGLQEKPDLEMEYRFRDAEGNWRWLMDRHAVTSRSEHGIKVTGAWSDITDRKEVEAEVRKQAGLITSLLNSIPDIIFFKDTEGIYLGCNPSFAEFVGMSQDEIIGKSDYDLFEKDVADFFRKHDRRMLEQLMPRHNEEWITYPDGRRILIDTLKTPYWGEDGKLIGILGISRDITVRKRAEEQLVVAKEQAEQASKAKSAFLANMSHEIRTPLNGVIGYADLLMKTSLDSVQKLYMENVNTSGKTLLNIINDILDLSKIEADKLELEIRETDIVQLLQQCSAIMEIQASKKGLELLLNIPREIPQLVSVDPVRLQQVITNLLGNAVKFTESGEVELKLEYRPGEKQHIEDGFVGEESGKKRYIEDGFVGEESGKKQHGEDGSGGENSGLDKHRGNGKDTDGTGIFTISVRDTGIGIKEDQKKNLFQAFTQADSSTTREYGGTGLGLIISQRLVEKMGGRIRFESSEGVGSTFYFAIEAGCRMKEDAGHDIPETLSVRKVLVIDDNAANRKILEASFRHWKIDCRDCESGVSAMKILESEQFDLLVVDYHMPEMNGLETVRAIREKYGDDPEKMPLILLYSSSDDAMLADECKKLGIQFTLIKPVKTSELYACIRNIRLPEARRAPDPEQELTVPETGTISDQDVVSPAAEGVIDQEALAPDPKQKLTVPDTGKRVATVLVVEDVAMNMHLAKALIGALEPDAGILEARNGNEAVELVKKEKIDLVLMDIQMPGMDGLEATRIIREWEVEQGTDKKLPIVALTAGALTEERDKALSCGMDDFLTKPIEPERLQGILQNYLGSD